MYWKTKARLQRIFSALPGGDHGNYFLQRHVTHSIPKNDDDFRFRVRLAREILDLVRKHATGTVGDLTFFEFGAGADLIGPLAFYAMGVNRQLLIDRSTLLRRSLVSDTLEKFARIGPRLGFSRLPVGRDHRPSRDRRDALRDEFGIDYRAPVDARATGLPERSVDVVTSNSTLEHVPQDELPALLNDCRRILRPGGLLAMRVDYEDHYAYSDVRVSPYNFLYYSEAEWKRYNPALHFQNRLRHSDYGERFRAAGLDILEEHRLDAGPETLAQLDATRLDARFRGYDLADLTVRKCTFLMRRGA